MADRSGDEPTDEEDRIARRQATLLLARRAIAWAVPLGLLGLLLVALGLPAWLVIVALVIAYAVVLFELDL